MQKIQKETETNIPIKKETIKETKKLDEIFAFIQYLKTENKLILSEKAFHRELILFFSVSDYRVIIMKAKIMETLDLIEIKETGWNKREIWIK